MEDTEFEIETKADLIARDANEQIVLLVKVSTDENEENNIQQLISTWKALRIVIPFAIFVNLQKISIYKRSESEFSNQPIKSFKTADVLRIYEPEFGQKRIFYSYLLTLFEAWLRDLAYHWKSKNTPGSEELEEIGLLQKIEIITTESNFDLSKLILKRSDNEVMQKIQEEILLMLPEGREFTLDNLPNDKQIKLKEVSKRILGLLYEYSQ